MKQILKRITVILMIAIMSLSIFSGCGSTKEPETQNEQQDEKISLDSKKVIFFGNSHTFYGNCVVEAESYKFKQEERTGDHGYFYQVCKANGSNVEVTNFTFGGHSLMDIYSGACSANRGHDGKDHMADLTDFNYDYVILQEGSSSTAGEMLVDECKPIMDAFLKGNPDTKFVFLVNHRLHFEDYAWKSSIKKLEDAGITVVDWGALVYDVVNGTTEVPGATLDFSKSSFIISKSEKDGYHPNMLTGYLTALMTYCAITGESAVGQSYSFVTDATIDPEFDIWTFMNNEYSYNPETNFNLILESDADMKGLQQLVDQYLEAKAYRNY